MPAAAAAARGVFRFGRCEVRPACREVLVDGRPRALQPRPFDLLVYLIEHRARVVTIDELLDTIWGDVCVQQGSLPAAIMRVRKALAAAGDEAGAEVIRTYSRVGYRFVAPLEGDSPAS
jgi:DNA-binding winged helix-turn-helix (wHTH) protein